MSAEILKFLNYVVTLITEERYMATRVAVMSIIVENGETVQRLNEILHEYGEYIIGRMGIPYKQRKINIISIGIAEIVRDAIIGP